MVMHRRWSDGANAKMELCRYDYCGVLGKVGSRYLDKILVRTVSAASRNNDRSNTTCK